MCYSRRKITGRIDCVSGRSSQRHTNCHDETCHREGSEFTHSYVKVRAFCIQVRNICINTEDENNEDEKP